MRGSRVRRVGVSEEQALAGNTVESRGFHPAAAVSSRVAGGPVVRNGKEDVGLFRPASHAAAKRPAQASDAPQRSNSACFDESFIPAQEANANVKGQTLPSQN